MTRLFLVYLLTFTCLLHSAEALITNGDFEMDEKDWLFSASAHTEAFAGCDGTAALLLQHPVNAKEDATAMQELNVAPGRCYTLEAWIRSDLRQGPPPTLGVDFATGKKGKKRLGGTEKSIDAPCKAAEWTCLTLEFTVPAETTVTRLTIALPRQTAGTLWVDKLTIKPTNRPFALALLYPLQGLIDENAQALRITIAKPGAADIREELVHKTLRITWENQTQMLRPATPIVEFPLESTLSQDFLNATVDLLDNGSQRTYATLPISLRVQHANAPMPDNALVLDQHQRATLHGQPLFPLGIVTTTPFPELADSPFRFVLPSPQAIRNIHSSDELRHFLDAWQRMHRQIMLPLDEKCWPWLNELTTIPELQRERLFADFANHPAMLAWQCSDTTETDDELRRQVNRADCMHPLCRMLDGTRLPTNYLNASDVLGGRVNAPSAEHPEASLTKARIWTQELVATQLPTWMVLHFPANGTASLDEMRATTLLMAILGAKGIFFDPTPLGENTQISEQEKTSHFARLTELALLVQELAPYLLSTLPHRAVPLIIKKGEAIAHEFTNPQGKRVILIVGGFLPSKTQATFSIPSNAVATSRFGFTKPKRDGQTWTFQCKGVCADLLELDVASKE